MNRKTVSGMMVTLLLVGTLLLAFSIQPVRAIGTIYIRPDGSIDPSSAPIHREGDLYTLTDNILSDTDGVVVERSNIIIDGAGYTLQGSGSGNGFYWYGINNVTIKNTNAKGFDYGIYNSFSSFNTVSGNNITNNNCHGIFLYSSENNLISKNTCEYNGLHGFQKHGIELWNSDNNLISNNTCSSNYDRGISLSHSDHNTISYNICENNYYHGIHLDYSSNTTVSNNTCEHNGVGINLDSSSSNTISRNNITANKYAGIRLDYSSNNSVSGNNIANPLGACIVLSSSSYNTITNNNIAMGSFGGINLAGSFNNTITNNNIANNSDGIYLAGSFNNTITNNNIANNNYGIFLVDSLDNRFYHNDFVDNAHPVKIVTSGYANSWDDGYPSGGNYWSDYEETYPDAEEIDNSGIWDTPYFIDENNQDNYPLMEPYSPIPTTVDELKTEIEELGSEGEITNQGIVTSLLAKLNVAQKLINDGKIDQAKNILNAFINEVQAQSGKHITPDAAELLIESVEYILSHI